MFFTIEQIFNHKLIKAIDRCKGIAGDGKEVSTLFLKKLNSGNQIYIFDGMNPANGSYYHQLVAGILRTASHIIVRDGKLVP